MVKLLTENLQRHYSHYGLRQSARNELRGASLHVAGAFSLFAGHILSLPSNSEPLEKESLTLTFFGAALYLLVHSQDVMAIRSANQDAHVAKSKRRKQQVLSHLSRESVISWIYLVGSFSLTIAVAFSNPRWTAISPISNKLQCVFAAVAFSFGASLNLLDETKSPSSRKVNQRYRTYLKSVAKVIFLIGSNFHLTGTVLQLKMFSSECPAVKRVSTGFYCVGVALQFIGGVVNRRSLTSSSLSKSAEFGNTQYDPDSGSESDYDRSRSSKRHARKTRGQGVMDWFRGTRERTEPSLNSSHQTDSTSEETDYNSSGSFSSDEEAVLRNKGKRRRVRRGR